MQDYPLRRCQKTFLVKESNGGGHSEEAMPLETTNVTLTVSFQ